MSDDELRAAIRDVARARACGRGQAACLGAAKLGRRGRACAAKTIGRPGSRTIAPRSCRSPRSRRRSTPRRFAIGTELAKTTQRPEWIDLIAAVRADLSGNLLFYVAHNADEAETVAVLAQARRDRRVALSAARRRRGSRRPARRHARHCRRGSMLCAHAPASRSSSARSGCARRKARRQSHGKAPRSVWPRRTRLLQAEVLADWLEVLRPAGASTACWSGAGSPIPTAGGPADTDFTVQGKPAEGVLLCAWTRRLRQTTDQNRYHAAKHQAVLLQRIAAGDRS